ncbi:MAG: OmpA family protein [Deltaproteobacteria bacterium]|nr:OmpA family protein [Deltaproteobacteria bacterium]
MKAVDMVFRSIVVSGTAGLLAACASAPPPAELVSARTAFERARSGEAGRRAPADLYDAQLALGRAEQAYLDDGRTDETRDLAYVAERRAQLAEARGRLLAAQSRERDARLQIEAIEDRQRIEAQQRLVGAEQRVEAERRARAATQSELTRERSARLDAEQRANAALESLRQMANVRQEEDRTIITLSGEVLFASGQATLLPIAQQRLDAVAQSLVDAGFESITVEGHTDSRGPFAQNEALSLHRAQAVRAYLVSRGLPADRVQAVGFGEVRPVAPNTSPEGRANNRRVELVVTPARGGAR